MRRLSVSGIAGSLVAAVSCGAPRAPAPPAPLTATTRQYAPLAMKDDARQGSLAVILGTSERDDATVLRLPVGSRSATIDAMFVSTSAGVGPRGGSISVRLTVSPNPTGALQLTGDGPDPRWRAGLWSAALVAASALGKDLPDVAVGAAMAGTVDGLDDSAAVAGGLIAAMIGEPIDPAATVAGTIDPDGTIGPVAGLPEQLLDAAAHGKTRFGFPAGQRIARSEATGKDIDLVELAHEHRAEAVELADLRDAYQLLTHRPLPAPVPVSDDDMALDRDLAARLDAQYAAWQQRLAGEWAAMLQLEQAGRLPPAIQTMVRLAHERSARAEALHRAGKLPAAYSRAVLAWVYAASCNATYSLLGKLSSGDVAGAVNALAALDATAARAADVFRKLAALTPATLGGQLAKLSATQAALRGWALHGVAGEAVAAASQQLQALAGKPAADLGGPVTADAITGALAPTVLIVFRTLAELTVAEQEQELEVDRGVPYTCAPASTARLAATFEAVSSAQLRYLDALLVEPLARTAHVAEDVARRQVAAREPNYLIASSLARLNGELPAELSPLSSGSDGPCALLPLAIHQQVFREAAWLIARYATLVTHTDDSGKIDAIAAPDAFRAMLANARRTARASARAARVATGAVPVQAVLSFQLASVEESGSLDDQLGALDDLWTANAYAQLAMMLARN